MMVTDTERRRRTGTRLAARGDGTVVLETLAREASVHPDLARRLIDLGLVSAAGGTTAAPLYRLEDAARLARAVRLRRDLGLNFSGAVLACELLARIDELEQRFAHVHHEVITWTRTV